MSELDTRALRALMEKATPGPWGKTPHEEKNDVCIWKPDGSWLANVGNWARCTIVVDGELVAPDNIETIEVEHDANAALIVALVNAAPALLDEVDALRAESEHFNERIDKLSRRVSYYENALCASPPRMWALPPDGALTGHIEPERVGAVLDERDALRARVAELEREVERVRAKECARCGYVWNFALAPRAEVQP